MSTSKSNNTAMNVQQPTHSKSNTKVSGEQESHRLREAQSLLQHLQELLTEGNISDLQILDDALTKAEQFSKETASNPNMDQETRKTLEDISKLLTSAHKLGDDKGIADRLQKISVESARALAASRREGVDSATKEKTEEIVNYIIACRPVFNLLMSSRDFRGLFIDTIKIARRIVYGYGEDIVEESKQKFVEGATKEEITQHVKEKTQQKEIPEMTDEEWETLHEDIQRVSLVMARDPEYKEGINRVFMLLDMFQNNISQERSSGGLPEEEHFRNAMKETQDLVASFSGKGTFDRFKNHLRKLIVDIQKNENLHNYLTEVKIFILKTRSEETVRSEKFKSKSKDLAQRGRDIMRELREKEDLRPFLQSADDMVQHIKNDELVQILRHHAGIVQSDLAYEDSNGQLHVDTDMLSKLNSVIMPVITDALKYIPLPRIESHTTERDFILDNVVLCGYDILPDNVRFHLESDSEVSVRDVEVEGTKTNLVISLILRTEFKDVDFYFNKKTFPKFDEKGKVTFRLDGDGAKLTIRFAVAQGPQDKLPRMRKGYASFDISKMSIDFDKSTLTHDFMVPMLTFLFKTQIRHEIEKEIENNLTGFVEKLADLLSSSLTNMTRPFLSGIDTAKKAVKNSQFAEVNEKRSEKLE